ncbi:unnamed protein product [Vitrella brassicaformis CCMP3155]|uniref:JmjC domain-containing protein n=1 Tax=Vitrella brassicaformis (strain CCMP3155) TaxID=1169540 RepID=A0A0G4EDD0_VITBC|nr:unnamed protein product [Vitrella brassicaformis CCMP3155]|eukprot:CEL93705.1 unnamed protein product [Vitrella brassicaformis CCMP3155]
MPAVRRGPAGVVEDWQKKVIDIKPTPIPSDGVLTPKLWRKLFLKGEKQGGLLLRPGPEFKSSAKGFDEAFFTDLKVTRKTKQRVVKQEGAPEGVMQIELERADVRKVTASGAKSRAAVNAKEFKSEPDGATPFPIGGTFSSEVEVKMWNMLSSGKCGYRYYADNLDRTMFDGIDKCPGLNLGFWEGNAVRLLPLMAGINTPFSYLGDLDLPSINYSHKGWHKGKAKVWYLVPAAFMEAVDELTKKHLPEEFAQCGQYNRHKAVLLHPRILVEAGIPVYRIVQEEGDFVVTLPGAYHQGFNLGFNMNEAVNFLPYDEVCVKMWLARALKAKPCSCKNSPLTGVPKWHPCSLVWRMELKEGEDGRELYKRLVGELADEGEAAESEVSRMDKFSPDSVQVIGCAQKDLIDTNCKKCRHRFTGLSVVELEGPGPNRWRTKYLCKKCLKPEPAAVDKGKANKPAASSGQVSGKAKRAGKGGGKKASKPAAPKQKGSVGGGCGTAASSARRVKKTPPMQRSPYGLRGGKKRGIEAAHNEAEPGEDVVMVESRRPKRARQNADRHEEAGRGDKKRKVDEQAAPPSKKKARHQD